MTRKQLEHILRASGSISGCREVIVIGSQAILGSFPDAPKELLQSLEADIYPKDTPDKADPIDGCIGELSPFHETFGYYAHGVSPETSDLPSNWKKRLVRVESKNTGGTIGWCLSPAGLAVSKLLAGREKDITYVKAMLKEKLVSKASIIALLDQLNSSKCRLAKKRLDLCFQ